MSYDYELGDAISGEAHWFEHPQKGQDVDIGAFWIDKNKLGKIRDIMGADGQDSSMFVDLGGELFLPGYPLGLTGGGFLPIWKRASLASSLEFGEGQHTKFLVDTASREGMSGAPCVAISNWSYYRRNDETGTLEIVHRPISWRLLGVYSGRLNAGDELGAQLGLVWRTELVFEVVRGGKIGNVSIR